MNKKHIIYGLCAIMLIYGLFDYINYTKNNYDVTGFIFICNPDICEIRHKKANGEIKYTDQIDISKIEKFRAQSEKVPRTNDEGMVIYADCKDGTSFRLSPVYVKASKYLDDELIGPLNEQLQKKRVSINIHFPY